MRIVHIVARDKFTNGYIKFMVSQFKDYPQIFFTTRGSYYLDRSSLACIYDVDQQIELIRNQQYSAMLRSADKIIISGVWVQTELMVAFLKIGLIKKTFFHFWGGDFYSYREPAGSLKSLVVRNLFFLAFSKAAGLVFLIDGEYEQFKRITHVSNRSFIAPEPDDPSDIKDWPDFSKYRNETVHRSINVLVGNSATASNFHEEVFERLKQYKTEWMKVYVPLSYGNTGYRETVVDKGFTMFGDSFSPLLDFMDSKDYIKFLTGMDVAIFYCDRQQAMGTINLLLGLGKKVYLRRGTSMWNAYVEQGFTIFDADSINQLSYEEFYGFDRMARRKNMERADEIADGLVLSWKQAWEAVFLADTK